MLFQGEIKTEALMKSVSKKCDGPKNWTYLYFIFSGLVLGKLRLFKQK